MVDLSPSFSKVREQFKFSELNKHQKEAIISAVLKKKDVFVSLPTGFGKSVIFQALSMIFDGFTGESGHIVIVVSPLLSLIKDQTERLRQVGISCVSLSDGSTLKEDFIRLFTRRQISVADNNNVHSIGSQKQRERNVSLS